ncbi:MAG: glycosyltransferase family 2 protein [Ilumatobacteraceae bacterium]
MRLTIYIPTFQRGELVNCLESILPQLNDQARLIVSDNDPEQSARKYCQDARILYSHNFLNVGADGNCLRSLNFTNDDYLWVFGDDDIMLPGAIEATLNMMNGQDRIIHLGERHGEVTAGFNGTTADWMAALEDKSMVVASTLCSMNVWRREALDAANGIRGLDTRNVMCWAGLDAMTVTVADTPHVHVGRNHPYPFPDFIRSMDLYLVALRSRHGNKTPFTMRDANRWNYANA